jgi:hypothetical protein
MNKSFDQALNDDDVETLWHVPDAAMVAIALVSMKIKAHDCLKIVEGNK